MNIPVKDQAHTLDLYTDKLGFTLLTDQPFDGKQRWIKLRIPKAETRLVLLTTGGDEKRIGTWMNLSFATGDIHATYAAYNAPNAEMSSALTFAIGFGTKSLTAKRKGARMGRLRGKFFSAKLSA